MYASLTLFTIDEKKCIKCRICAGECPVRVIKYTENHFPVATSDAELNCLDCGHCVIACPQSALTYRTMTPERYPPFKPEMLPTEKQVEYLLRIIARECLEIIQG